MIDVLTGIACAVIGILLFEQVFMRLPVFSSIYVPIYCLYLIIDREANSEIGGEIPPYPPENYDNEVTPDIYRPVYGDVEFGVSSTAHFGIEK